MSKERLEQIKINAFKNRNYDITKLMHGDVVWLIEQAECVQELEGHITKMAISRYKDSEELDELHKQNKRYRELLESIRCTHDIAQEIHAKNPNIKVITPDDLLQHIMRKVNKGLGGVE